MIHLHISLIFVPMSILYHYHNTYPISFCGTTLTHYESWLVLYIHQIRPICNVYMFCKTNNRKKNKRLAVKCPTKSESVVYIGERQQGISISRNVNTPFTSHRSCYSIYMYIINTQILNIN